ncbi:MAG: MarC family protein [Nitriliruptorales bacterium]|nr:MarC family protein [Nitriliruptorales bacterium]
MELDFTLATQAFVTLLVIMDPLGNVPVFLSLTGGMEQDARRRVAAQAVISATAIVYLFAIFGSQILSYLSISLEALQVAGGVMLFITALSMFRGELDDPDPEQGASVAVVPLGTPMVAGPGAIAAVMVFMAGDVGVGTRLENQLSVVLAVTAALAVVYVALRYGTWLERLLKDKGILLVTRVMGMLLLAISVELIASGITAYTA